VKRFSKRLDRLESRFLPKEEKEWKTHLIKLGRGEVRPSSQELDQIKEKTGCDLVLILSPE
jgi:hypothetical protein